MAIFKENYIDIDLLQGSVQRGFTNRMLGEGDANGDRFGVRVMKGGEPYNISGTSCIGYFIRADKVTLIINGTVSENTAYVDLPEAAYAVSGNFTLAIKIGGVGYTETLRVVDGTVIDTTTGDVRDPASEIPSIEDLLEVIGQAEEAAETIEGLQITATQVEGTRYKISVTKE